MNVGDATASPTLKSQPQTEGGWGEYASRRLQAIRVFDFRPKGIVHVGGQSTAADDGTRWRVVLSTLLCHKMARERREEGVVVMLDILEQ